MRRPLLRLCGLLGALAILAGALSAQAAPRPAPPPPGLYIVQLAGPPLPSGGEEAAQPRAAADVQSRALADVAAAVGGPVAPRFTYSHALSGFAIPLTPAEARAVARLPGVAAVAPDEPQQLHTDTGPAHIGAAQPDQRPAIFRADLAATEPGGRAAGSAVLVYAAGTRTLQVQAFYRDLGGGPPVSAALSLGAGGPVAVNLAPLAVPGGFVGALALADVPGGPSAAEVEAALMAGTLVAEVRADGGSALRGLVAPVRGEGVLVGVIDSGIDPSSPSFASPGPDGHVFANPLGPGVYRGVCSQEDGDGRYDPAFPCNAKLIGAYTFPTTDESPAPGGRPSPRDNHGHGSHTASIAAGNVVPAVPVGGATIGPVAGVAPHATLIAYDVCGLEPASEPTNALRCSTAAILAAIDQALADGVDVINHSIGGGSRNPWASADSLGFLAALRAGVFVAASAGNGGPAPGSISAPANAPWVTAVAAATHGRSFANALADLAGGQAGARPQGPVQGRGFSAAYGPAPVVAAAAFPDAAGRPNGGCDRFDPAVDLRGAIVVCQRTLLPRLTMAANARAAGAGGAVIANDPLSAENLGDDSYPLPAVQVGFTAGQALLAWASGCGDCGARIAGTSRAVSPAAADVLASFSARGPDRSSPEVLKPDLAAPGVSVLAAGLDVRPDAPDYQLLSGTSMAAPHVAGAAALLRQLHPGWTPAEIRSALLLTAAPGVRGDDGVAPAGPHERGAGRVDVGRAARAGLVMDERAEAFRAADPALLGRPETLNLPGLAEAECAATCVFTRTLRSTLPVAATWSAAGQGGAPLALTVEPASLTLAPGATGTITVTARIGQQPAGTSYSGAVSLTERGGLAPGAALPVAVRSAVSNLPPALARTVVTARGGATLDARAWAIADFTATVYGLARLAPEGVALAQDPTPESAGDVAAGGVYVRPLALPAGTTRLRAEVGSSTATDLDLFVFRDDDGDSAPDPGEVLCASTGPRAVEVCDLPATDLIAGSAAAAQVAIAVQNVQGSRPEDPGFTDSLVLSVGVLGREAAGNLAVAGPRTTAAGEPFRLALSWDLGAPRPGDVFIGVVGVGSAPAAPGDRGAFPVTLTYDPPTVSLPLVRR